MKICFGVAIPSIYISGTCGIVGCAVYSAGEDNVLGCGILVAEENFVFDCPVTVKFKCRIVNYCNIIVNTIKIKSAVGPFCTEDGSMVAISADIVENRSGTLIKEPVGNRVAVGSAGNTLRKKS